jgi:hypothetical protein
MFATPEEKAILGRGKKRLSAQLTEISITGGKLGEEMAKQMAPTTYEAHAAEMAKFELENLPILAKNIEAINARMLALSADKKTAISPEAAAQKIIEQERRAHPSSGLSMQDFIDAFKKIGVFITVDENGAKVTKVVRNGQG